MRFHPEEVLFSPTTNCNLDCPHCCTEKSSRILPRKLAERFLVGCKGLGIKKVGFTGGEPFLALDFLCSLVKTAIKEGFIFDRIMTNGVWYGGERDLKASLTKLYNAGYDGSICISVDAFHSQNLKKLARFIRTALSIWKRPDVISIAYTAGAQENSTKAKLTALSVLLEAIKNKSLFIKILKIDLSPVGKAERLKNAWDGKWFKEDYCKGPGNVFFVMPDGDVKPCCGYASDLKELTIGNIRRDSGLDIMKNAKRNRFVFTIFNRGLTKIRKGLQDLGVRFPGKTRNHCYFCNYILTKVPKDILNRCLAAILIFFGLVISSSAEAQILKQAKNYRTIPVKVIKKIKLPKWYHEGLFYDGKDIWVINGEKGNAWVIDSLSGLLISDIGPIGGFTEGITKAPDDRFFVTDWDEKKLYLARIEEKRMKAESCISLAPAYPAGVVWDGSRLFVITWTRGLGTKFHLLEMDGHMNLVRKILIRRIQEPAHLAWDGKNLWITSWHKRLVYKVDVNSLEITGAFRSPAMRTTGIAWDGKYFWLTGTYDDLYQLEVIE